MIRIENLNKSFDGIKILKNISTNFEKGKTNLIIGQSGSGKTVLLKTILGLIEAENGNIIFGDKSISNMKEKERAKLRQDIGMVFQGSALFDSLNVEENVMFPMKMFTNKPNEEILDKANVAIKRVNLINSNNKMPAELSGLSLIHI